MDTSKEYIEQCDCPEIQEKWKSEVGDKYCRVFKDAPGRLNDVRSYVATVPATVLKECKNFKYIWLPRQDQLQEMHEMDGDRLDVHSYFNLFNKYQMNTVPPKNASAEKLMLMFLMNELHNKEWRDGEWQDIVAHTWSM